MSSTLGLLLVTLVSQSPGPALSPPPDPPSIYLDEAALGTDTPTGPPGSGPSTGERVEKPAASAPEPAPPAPESPPPAPKHESVRERAVRLAKVPRYPRLERVEAWLPAGLGVLAVCGSAYLFVNAGFVHQTLEREGLADLDEIAAVSRQGQRLQNWGWVGMGAAATLFGVAAFGVLHPDPKPTTRLSISLSDRGAGLFWAGSF